VRDGDMFYQQVKQSSRGRKILFAAANKIFVTTIKL
jgi:hypothetical protein